MNRDSRYNVAAGLGIGTFAVLAIGLVAALVGSKSGEIAGALGAVIGGAIGALGSAAAVYIMLSLQRAEESEKVSAAVLNEVAELSKFPVGQLEVCELIQSGKFSFPKADLPKLMHTPDAVIYPAVADRISRLPRPILVVSFYTRLAEARGVAEVIAYSPPVGEVMMPHHVEGLADILISICQLAGFILRSVDPQPGEELALATETRTVVLARLDEQLTTARLAFPNAISWRQEVDSARVMTG